MNSVLFVCQRIALFVFLAKIANTQFQRNFKHDDWVEHMCPQSYKIRQLYFSSMPTHQQERGGNGVQLRWMATSWKREKSSLDGAGQKWSPAKLGWLPPSRQGDSPACLASWVHISQHSRPVLIYQTVRFEFTNWWLQLFRGLKTLNLPGGTHKSSGLKMRKYLPRNTKKVCNHLS